MTTKYLLVAALLGAVVLPSCDGDDDATRPESTPTTEAAQSATPGTDGTTTPDSGTATDGPSSTADTTESSVAPSTTEARPDAVVDVDVQPGQATDEFVGAREDVSLDHCERQGDEWTVDGTVANASGADAAYRIYVALNVADSADTRGLVQIDVDVADGATEEWSTTIPVAEDNLTCILRVERVATP